MELNILKQIRSITAIKSHIYFYVFGSSLKPHTLQNDIDILVIYKEAEDPEMIRKLLDETNLPIDLIFFTKEEEIELDFINEVNAKIIV